MNWERLLSKKRIKDLMEPAYAAAIEVDVNQYGEFSDPRSEYMRDYDRIIFSAPFRRLQDKAQVFPMDRNDSVRTRLTHSLEVSGVARGLASSAAKWLVRNEKITVPDTSTIQEKHDAVISICAAGGLIHDLGNPPFGHAGEAAIQGWFERNKEDVFAGISGGPEGALTKDFRRFEGNAQTVRLLTRLQILYHHYGMNLTCATQSACLKYTSRSHELSNSKSSHSSSKPGYFYSEENVISALREETGTGASRHPLTFLIEAADDVVYSVADVEDGVKKGVLTWNDIQDKLSELKDDEFTKRCLESVRRAVDGGAKMPNKGEAKAQYLRIHAIGNYIPCVVEAWTSNYDAIMAGDFDTELYTITEAGPFVNALKELARRYVYVSPDTLKLEILGREVINYLMDLFWEGISNMQPGPEELSAKTFSGKIARLMSDNYRLAFNQACGEGRDVRYSQLQLLTDYVCGMTDTFATSLYNQLRHGQ